MRNRGALGRVFSTLVLAAPLWAWSGGLASAQCIDCPPPPPPPGFVSCPAPDGCTNSEGPCTPSPVVCPAGHYAFGQRVNVFSFGTDNSIQIKFADVPCADGLDLKVTLVPTNQSDFLNRLKSTSCPAPPEPFLSYDGASCNETLTLDVNDNPTSFCAVYRVDLVGAPGTSSCYTGPVEYLVGWKAPNKGNKHDFYLLRDPDSFDPDYDSAHPQCFIQNITDGGVIMNYKPGGAVDPGLGGKACCPSDYIIARQKIRPVAK